MAPAPSRKVHPARYCGRVFSGPELAEIRQIIERKPPASRTAISRQVCESLGWRKPDGGLKDMSCRVALLRMHADGLVCLPPPRPTHLRNAAGCSRRTLQGEPQPDLRVPAGTLGDLTVDLVSTRDESRLWNEYIDRYHYLGHQPLPGAQLRYFARAQGRVLALLGFGAAAWQVAPRDRFIGWCDDQRRLRLHLVVNNARFLILPWVYSHNFGSRLLAIAARRLPTDWEARYNYRPVLLETFIEKPRFAGTCYRAANWIYLGDTTGRGKLEKHHAPVLATKSIWAFPLVKDFREQLTRTLDQPSAPPQLALATA